MINKFLTFSARTLNLLLVLFLFANCFANNNLKLLLPKNNETTNNSFPQFFWNAHLAAFKDTSKPVKYIIQISKDKSFVSCIDEDTVFLNRYVCDKPLPCGYYFWRVRAITSNNNTEKWSGISAFLITPTDAKNIVIHNPLVENNQEEIQNAINEAISLSKRGKSVEIFFPKGIYNCESPNKYFLQIKNARNILINGNGSTVNLLAANQTFCKLSNCQNVVVRGFIIDFPKQMTFTQGIVSGVDIEKGEVEVNIEPNFPTYDDEYFVGNKNSPGLLMDPKIAGRIKSNVGDNYLFDMSKIYKKSGRVYVLPLRLITSSIVKGAIVGSKNLSDYAKDFNVGDRFVQTTRGIQSSILFADSCCNITCYDITNYAVGGMHYVGLYCSGMVFLHCKALMKENRWWQGNADGIHLRSNRVGPWIEHCEINGIGDDAIALYSRPMTISKCFPDNKRNTLILKADHFYMEPHDRITFFNPRQGKIMLETRVKKIKKIGNEYLVEFEDKLLPSLNIIGAIRDVDQIWNRSISCGDFVIRNNTFNNIRRFGTVFRARTGIVENNTYQACSTSAIVFLNETPWPNGLYCSDIIVKNNKISDCGFTRGSFGIISFTFRSGADGIVSGIKPAESCGPDNILIENNVLSNIHSKKAIELWSVQNVVVRNNLIDKQNLDKNNSNHISLVHSENVGF